MIFNNQRLTEVMWAGQPTKIFIFKNIKNYMIKIHPTKISYILKIYILLSIKK